MRRVEASFRHWETRSRLLRVTDALPSSPRRVRRPASSPPPLFLLHLQLHTQAFQRSPPGCSWGPALVPALLSLSGRRTAPKFVLRKPEAGETLVLRSKGFKKNVRPVPLQKCINTLALHRFLGFYLLGVRVTSSVVSRSRAQRLSSAWPHVHSFSGSCPQVITGI